MSQQRAPFGLRLPDPLKAKVQEQAQRNGRSMNREVCYRLEQAYLSEETAREE